MKFNILAIGGLKTGPEKALCDDYIARSAVLGRTAGITAVEIKEFAEASLKDARQRIEAEAKSLSDATPPRAFRIALDEHGRPLTTAEFAAFLRRQMDAGVAEIAFLIGGADGHAESTRAAAQFILSLGPLTWPHRLVRVMLAEQIYRAVTIMVNHPYHRP